MSNINEMSKVSVQHKCLQDGELYSVGLRTDQELLMYMITSGRPISLLYICYTTDVISAYNVY